MKNRNERIQAYFEEIKKDSFISSWYLAKKFKLTRNQVASDLEYAKKKEFVTYQRIYNFCNLQLNFILTDKGINYEIPEPQALTPEQDFKEFFRNELTREQRVEYYLKEINKSKWKGVQTSQLVEKFGFSKKSIKTDLRTFQFSGRIGFDANRQVYLSTLYIGINNCFKGIQNLVRKGVAAI
jgi:hypothetical protein